MWRCVFTCHAHVGMWQWPHTTCLPLSLPELERAAARPPSSLYPAALLHCRRRCCSPSSRHQWGRGARASLPPTVAHLQWRKEKGIVLLPSPVPHPSTGGMARSKWGCPRRDDPLVTGRCAWHHAPCTRHRRGGREEKEGAGHAQPHPSPLATITGEAPLLSSATWRGRAARRRALWTPHRHRGGRHHCSSAPLTSWPRMATAWSFVVLDPTRDV
jgi:hypothetical protein